MEEDARIGAPGGESGLSPGEGEEAQGSDAAGAVAAGGVVRGRGVGQGRSRTEVLIIVNTGWPGARGVQEGRGDEEGSRRGGLGETAKVGDGKGGVGRTQGVEERHIGAQVRRKGQGHGRR